MPLIKITEASYNHDRKRRLSSHALMEFARSPRRFKLLLDGLMPQKDQAFFTFGRAVHCATLEGIEEFRRRFVSANEGPINPKTQRPYGSGKELNAWIHAQRQSGVEVLEHDEMIQARDMAEAVHAHPVAGHLLSSGEAELTAQGELFGIPAQSRFDWLHREKDVLVDLKTTKDLQWFTQDARRYMYDIQLAFYQLLYAECTGYGFSEMHIIAVEKSYPYDVICYFIDPHIIEAATQKIERLCMQISECTEAGSWPTGTEAERTLTWQTGGQ